MRLWRVTACLLAAGLLSGCGVALVGRMENGNTARYGLLPIYSLSDMNSLVAIYEHNLPRESLMLLQLWSQDAKPETKPDKE